MGTAYRLYGLRLSDGARGVPAVEREIVGALPPGTTYSFHITSVVEGQVDRAVKPEAIALAVFGIIAMAAALLIAVQAIARQLQARDEDIGVLRALGASPAMTMGEGLLGILGAVVLGSLLAAGVAIGLSPLSPIGPVRPVYPAPGFEVDVVVLGFGLLALIGGIGAASVGLAYRQAPGRARQRSGPMPREVRAWYVWRRAPARRCPRSPVSASPSNRGTAEPPCRCGRQSPAPYSRC
jgi:predicted lysophospholipase L1 biosynthesis ABC-type transport system permease subunit